MLETPSSRRYLLFVLVACFIGQTAMVYFDDSGRQKPPLSDRAQIGWQVWHKNNCQSCHQIFGYGGFLGPDLTNAIDQLTPERLQSILTVGAKPMPAFHLSENEIDGVAALLGELNGLGVGQLRLKTTPPAPALLDQFIEDLSQQVPLSPSAQLGRKVFKEKKCITCHLPNLQNTAQGPDLCQALERLGNDGITATIRNGRLAAGMPAFDLTSTEEQGICAFFGWLKANSKGLAANFKSAQESGDTSRLPWFEYSK